MSKDYKITRSDKGTVEEYSGEKIRKIFSDEELGIGVEEIETEDGEQHFHGGTHEIYVATEGEGEMEVDGDVVHIGEGDSIYIPPGTPHRIYTEYGFVETLVISIPPLSEEDQHELEG